MDADYTIRLPAIANREVYIFSAYVERVIQHAQAIGISSSYMVGENCVRLGRGYRHISFNDFMALKKEDEKMFVRITKVTEKNSWYWGKVGQVFSVMSRDDTWWRCRDDTTFLIRKDECEVLQMGDFTETPKKEPVIFEPFQKVLVRDDDRVNWEPDFYYRLDGVNYPHCTFRGKWKQCIPYEGNEELLGTTGSPK